MLFFIQSLSAVILAFAILQNLFYLLMVVLAVNELILNRRFSLLARDPILMDHHTVPGISILVPAYNESATIVESVTSLLNLRYPNYEVVVINDGSTDETARTLIEAFDLRTSERAYPRVVKHERVRGLYANPRYPNLLFVDKNNGGKADALNAGLNVARKSLFCAVDADSILNPDSLLDVVKPFVEDPIECLAVGGTIRIANGSRIERGMVTEERVPASVLPLFQTVEYFRAFLLSRLAFSNLRGVGIISGAFGLFKRDAVMQIGGYRLDTVGEDMELVIRLHRHAIEHGIPYKIRNVPEPVCWTEAPEDLRILRRQRTRWQRGMLETLFNHRTMLFNPAYGRMGTFIMPYFFLFDVVGPVLDLVGLICIPILFGLGFLSPEFFLAYFAVVIFFGIFLSMLSIVVGELSLFPVSYHI